MSTLIKALVCIAVAALFFLSSAPSGLETNAWHFLGLFVAIILAIILQVGRIEIVCIVAICIVALSGITVSDSTKNAQRIAHLSKLISKSDPSFNIKQSLQNSELKALQAATKSDSSDISALRAKALKLEGKAKLASLVAKAKIKGLKEALSTKMSMESINKSVEKKVAAFSSKQAIKDAISSFSNTLIWLIVASIMVARGIIKTGLGSRLAYLFINLFGKKTLGVGYSIVLSELILAPITPSNTARAGGIINPIVQAIARSFKSSPEDGTQSKIGTYLSLVNYQANPISSAMFITATAPNPLVVDLIAKATKLDIQITWGQWALGMFVPGIAAMILMPLVIYWLAKPEITATPQAAKYAKDKLKELGPMKNNEKIMLGIFIILLALWSGLGDLIFGIKFNSTAVAFLGLSLALISGVLSAKDVLSETQAWSTMIWFSALIMMATMLGKLGVSAYLTTELGELAKSMGLGPISIMFFLSIAFLYAHYFFASTTAHISAMFFVFYSTGLAFGAPPLLFAFIMLSSGNIMMALTHYATGTSPVVFSTGYVSLKKWWQVGFIMSVVDQIVIIGVGLIWWKILGFY